MKFSTAVSVGLGLAGITTAAPLTARDGKSAADIILAIAPSSGTCAADKTECRTNQQVAPWMIKAMDQYGINTPAAIAAVLALTAFESVNYVFSTNQGGNLGQGTSNMQMYKYNLLYAQSIPALSDKLNALGTPEALLVASDKQTMNGVRDLVRADEYNFGSGPWFLTTQCTDPKATTASIISTLNSSPDDGFALYMACVGVGVTGPRNEYWTRAKQAFGI
ncbi:hypothetical protein F4859DRAFT_182478 [Xylaria cf. heliscus]|nr:hypothetical protein F4859DRAFT_182478 [Xylaria cf. heliscus]